MAFEPLVWYCRPVGNGIWSQETDSAFGAYTPCGMDSLVVCISNLVLLGLSIYRMWLTINDYSVKRFRLTSKYYNLFLGFFAACCTAEPVFRLVSRISIFDFDAQTTLAPFEMVSLIIEALAWSSLVTMIGLETRIYIREFRWYVRFGVIYVLVGDAAMLNFILSVKDNYPRYVLYVYISSLLCKAFFGILLLPYVPHLDPYPGYMPLRNESLDDTKYEALPGEEYICPERNANIFSKIYFGWVTPLMQQGYRKPITEKDVWKLDTWDQTEILSRKFQNCWTEESHKSKPWLLRALNGCVGGRFWYGGFFKVITSSPHYSLICKLLVWILMLSQLEQYLMYGFARKV